MVLLGDMRGGYICTEMSLSKRLKCLKVRWREKLGTNRIVKLISESHFQILFPDCNFPFFLGDSKNMFFYINYRFSYSTLFIINRWSNDLLQWWNIHNKGCEVVKVHLYFSKLTNFIREGFTKKKVAVLLDFVQKRAWGKALPKFLAPFHKCIFGQ